MRSTLLLLTLACAVPVQAQDVAVGISAARDLWEYDPQLRLPVSVHISGTVPLSDRFSLEPFYSRGWTRLHLHRREAQGIYGVQLRQGLARFRRQGTTTFVTYGVGGYYDGRAFRPPVAGFVGAGVRHTLGGRVAVRPELQFVNAFFVVPMTVRANVSLSVDISRARRRAD